MENVNQPSINFDDEIIEYDSEHNEDWLDDDSVSDEEKLAYFNSLDWQPGRNLATEFGITTREGREEFMRLRALGLEPKPRNLD